MNGRRLSALGCQLGRAGAGGLDVNGDRKLDSNDEGAQNNIFFGVGLTFMLPPSARQSR